MKDNLELTRELKKSVICVSALTLIFLLLYRSSDSIIYTLIALPFFVAVYFFFFSIGRDGVKSSLRTWIGGDILKVTIFPLSLMFLYTLYLLINRQNPLQGALALTPNLIVIPLLVFATKRQDSLKITWIDFTALVVYVISTSLIHVSKGGNLPFYGESFDSLSQIFLILIGVYTFSVIRGLDDVGFLPLFNLKYLWRAIWVWFVFYLFVVVVGYGVDFIKVVGYDSSLPVMLKAIAISLVGTFFHTAIFEELFFRGILQNMFAKRIGQSRSWKIFWICGFIILMPLALVVGYTLNGNLKWFPALMSLIIFAAAYAIESSKRQKQGVYTGLAITSVLFGLVHYHSGAIIYIGFACIAGWAYGYTYIKTKNVFYSAVVHTLVNCSALIFGLEFMM